MSDDPYALPRLSERISTRGRLPRQEWVLLAITLPVWLIGFTASTYPHQVRPGTLPVVFAVALVAALQIFALERLESYLHQRTRSRASMTRFLFAYALIGAITGATCIAGLRLGNLVDPMPPLARILSYAAIISWSAAMLGLFLEGRLRVEVLHQSLIEREAAILLGPRGQHELIATLRLTIHQAAMDELSPALSAVENRLTSHDTGLDPVPARDLHEASRSSIRSLSHRLDASSRLGTFQLRFLPSLLGVVRNQPLRPLAVSGIYLLTYLPSRWQEVGFATAATESALGILAITGVMGLANLLMRRFPRWHGAIFIGAALALPIPMAISTIATSVGDLWSVVFPVTVDITLSCVLILMTSGFGSWRESQTDTLLTFRAELDDRRVTELVQAQVIAVLTREAARVLHGPVQSRLTACALAIDRAVATDDPTMYASALSDAARLLTEPWDWRLEPMDLSLQDEIFAATEPWQGLAEIDVVIDERLSRGHSPANSGIGRLVEEAVSNAVRHGKAVNVRVTVEPIDAMNLRVFIADNGQGPTAGPAGLGTALITELTEGRWDLSPGQCGRGATLTADVRF